MCIHRSCSIKHAHDHLVIYIIVILKIVYTGILYRDNNYIRNVTFYELVATIVVVVLDPLSHTSL